MAERLNDNPEKLRHLEAEADRAVDLFSGVSGGGIGGTIVNAKGATALERLGLRAAKALDRIGVPARVNHALTGWFQWPTTKEWLTEFSDRGARAKDLGGFDEWRPLSEALDHPELYKRFPDLADVRTRTRLAPEIQGSHQSEDWVFAENGRIVGGRPEEVTAAGPNLGEIRGVLLHEAGGHAVQDRLGLSNGGNADFVREKARRAIEQLAPKNESLSNAYQYFDNLDQGMSHLEAMQGLPREAIRKAQQYGRAGIEEKINQVGDAFQGWGRVYDRPQDGYRHLGGEAMAELIRHRRNLSPVGLRQTYPLDHLPDLGLDESRLLELNTPGVRPGLSAAVKGWIK